MGRSAKSNNGRINWLVSNGRLSEYGPDLKFMLTGIDTLRLLQVLESGEPATSVHGGTTWKVQDGQLKETSLAGEIALSTYDTETLRELLFAEREAIIVAAEVEEALRSDRNRELFFEDDFADEEEEDDAETF